MKRFLLATMICLSTIFSPVQAVDATVGSWFDTVLLKTKDITPLKIAAVGFGAAGIYYVYSKLPSNQYASAQKAYYVIDEGIIRLLEDFDANDDIAQFAAEMYPKSPYPLVALFEALNTAHDNATGAIKKVENALWWSKDEKLARAGARLKNALQERLNVLEAYNSLVRAHSAWSSQYALYLQKCQNDEMRNLSTQVALNGMQHCCHYYQK